MKTKILLAGIIAAGYICTTNAQESSGAFVRNDGQLTDTEGNLRPDLKYYGTFSDRQMYFATGKISHVWHKEGDTASNAPDTLGRMDMEFLNSNTTAQITAEQQEQGYLNFFLGHIPDGVVNVPAYEKITYQDLYANTALKVTKEQGKVNYEVTFHPGANANTFQLKFTGITALEVLQNGGMRAKNHLGETEFEKPKGKRKTGEGQYTPVNVTLNKIGNDIISISIQNYQSNKEYKINIGEKKVNPSQPNPPDNPADINGCKLGWSTYYGDIGTEEAIRTQIDNSGNIYVVGNAFSVYFPVANGVQMSYGSGSSDAFVLKFDVNREREWATFYGGSGIDRASALAVDEGSNVYFTGYTSSTNFPKQDAFSGTDDYYQPSLQGGTNAYIVKLNALGNLKLWSTYFGKAGNLWEGSLALSGNFIYLAGWMGANGIIPFPVTPPTGFVQANKNGNFEGFIAKFKRNTFKHEWSTYFGGNGYDRISDCAVDINNNLIIMGNTTADSQCQSCAPCENSFPLCKTQTDAFVEGNHGGFDMFAAKFDPENSLIWSTQFGGSHHEFMQNYFSVATDNDGSIYCTGRTVSVDFPVISEYPDAYTQPLASYPWSDGFIVKFLSSGKHVWSTCYGGTDDDEIRDIAVNPEGEIFITGITLSTDFPNKTVGTFYNQTLINKNGSAYDNENLPMYDGFIARFGTDLSQKWSTYFGGNLPDRGNGIAASTTNLALVGWTRSKYLDLSFPLKDKFGTTDYFDGSLGGGDDAYVSDFNICDPPSGRLAGNQLKENEDEEQLTENNIRLIYPNPANSTLHLEGFAKTQIKIYNIMGEVIYSGFANSNTISINVTKFAKGIYLVQIDDQISKKIIIE